MNDREARRIVTARSLMWDAATGDEQAAWLRQADDALASLEQAAARPAQPSSEHEADQRTFYGGGG